MKERERERQRERDRERDTHRDTERERFNVSHSQFGGVPAIRYLKYVPFRCLL